MDFKKLDFIVSFLNKTLPEKGIGLDLGCGQGCIMVPLISMGYQMIGVDIRQISLKKCKRNITHESIGTGSNLFFGRRSTSTSIQG